MEASGEGVVAERGGDVGEAVAGEEVEYSVHLRLLHVRWLIIGEAKGAEAKRRRNPWEDRGRAEYGGRGVLML